MSDAFFPLTFASEELRLLTGLALGFLFGFVLERSGFGNARKLAGQRRMNSANWVRSPLESLIPIKLGTSRAMRATVAGSRSTPVRPGLL